MHDDDGTTDGYLEFVLDASEGGYFLASFGDDQDESILGDVLAQAPAEEPGWLGEADHAVVVCSLGGVDVDERVGLWVTVFGKEEDVPLRPGRTSGPPNWDRGHRFSIDAPHGLLVITFDTEEQHRITDRPGIYEGHLAMRVRDPLEPGDPHETHRLDIWPAESSDDNFMWWRNDGAVRSV